MKVGTKQTGFTIVELLIVVVVIAILAAITIVAYNGITNQAKSSALKSTASQAAKKVALAAVNDSDQYPADKAAFQTATGLNDTSNETYDYIVSDARKNYCVSVTNAKGDSSSSVSNGSGSVVGRCVQNLVLNPSAEGNINGLSASGGVGGVITSGANSTAAFSGSSLYRVVWTTPPTSNSSSWVASSSATGLNAGGKAYIASGYVRASWSGSTFGLNLVGRTGGGGVTSETYGTSVTLSPGVWTRLSVTWTAPANTDYFEVRLRQVGGSLPAAGSTMDGDAFMLNEGGSLYSYGGPETPNWAIKAASGNSVSFGPAPSQ